MIGVLERVLRLHRASRHLLRSLCNLAPLGRESRSIPTLQATAKSFGILMTCLHQQLRRPGAEFLMGLGTVDDDRGAATKLSSPGADLHQWDGDCPWDAAPVVLL